MSGPATARRRAAGGRRGAALLALALAACGSSRPGAPHPTSITPDGGPQVVPVAVRIRGEGFGAQVSADLSGGGGVVDARFQALLGDTPLDDVALQQDGSIAATVPAGMAAGLHDLTVVGPDGRSGRLAGAYRVVAPGATARRVAAYRFDAVGPQVARSPFTVTVTAVDAAGEVVSDFTGTASLSDLGGTAVPASVGLFAAGRWTGLVELRGPHAADVLTMSDAGGATGSSAAFAVRPAPAALVRLDAGGAAVTAGECAGPITLSLLDAFGQPTTAEADTTLALAALPAAGFALHADPACGAPVSSPVVAAGQGSVAVWFTATTAGALQLTASGTALPPVARTWSVAAGLPAALVFLSDPLRAVAGVCSGAATVEVRDAFGNLSDGGVPALALAASPSTDFELFSDACGTPAVSLAVVAGATTATFHFRGTAAGVVTVGVSAAGLAGASQDEAIDPAAATSLAFATDPRAARAGACSAGLTVEARDPWGNAVAGVADVPVALSAAPGGDFAFHADAACGGATPAVAIPAGDSRATFFFRGTASGDVAVTAASPGLSAANQTARVDPGLPAAVIFSTPARTVEVRACSAAVGLAVLDAFGNASPVEAPLSVGIGASPPGGFGLFADGGCTIPLAAVTVPAGSDAALFHFSAPDVGSLVVTATPAGLTGATQTESVVAAASQRLAFTTDPQIVQAGSCSAPVTVEAQDAYGNPTVVSTTAATPVTLSGTDLAFFAGAGCTGGAVTFAAGATTATFSFRRSVPGTGTVEVTASAGMLAGAQTETIVAGPASGLVFTTGPQTVQAGACSGAAVLEARDLAGNPVAISGAVATPVTLSGADLAFFAGAGCTGGAVTFAAGATTATFSFRRSVPGTGTVDVTASAGALTPAFQTETIVLGGASQLVFTTGPQTVQAGACSGAAVLEARDLAGNPVAISGAAATPVTLSGADLAFFAGAGCTGGAVTFAAGATTATFSFRRSVPGTGTVDVTASAGALTPAFQTETIVLGGASQLVFTTGPQTVQAGACSGDVTVESQDAAGNPSSVPAATPVNLTGAGLTFHAGGGCGGGAVTEVSIPSGGTSVTFSFRGTTAGPASITAAAAGFASAIQGQTIEPGPLHHLTWAAIASPQGAGAPFGVTVTARDAAENLVAYGGTATLTASAGTVSCTTSCTSASVTAAFGAGTWSGTVTVPSAAASVTLTATAAAGPSGTSNAFDVEGTWAPRSPPFARFTAAPRLIVSGNPIGFDPGASSDRQTAAGALTMSWDWDAQGAASYAQPAAPPAAPWTPWETLAPTTHTYINNSGVAQVYRPRLAVRDTEGGGGGPDVGYAGGLVVVLPNGNDFCVVNTSSLADDGATGCYGPGPDGRLSLAEAVRLANGWAGTLNITFSDPMTITSTATVSSLTLSRAARLIGIPGVVLNGVSLTAAADDVLVAGLEFRNLSTPITVRSQVASDARLEDLVVHDGAGVLVQGRGLLNRLTMYGCAGACVRQTGTSDLALWSSDLHGAGAGTGVAMEGCGSGTYSQAMESPYFAWTTNGWQTTGSAAVFSTVLTGFATGIDIGPHGACAEPYLSNLTFDGNGTGVRRDASAGGGGLLLDSVFTGQTAAAVDPAACGFFIVARSATYGNASLGCLTPDLTADPLYVWRAGRDFRIQYASPLKDQANPVNVIELDDAGPGLYLGANPDRGGRETY